jgi:cell division protein FtsL
VASAAQAAVQPQPLIQPQPRPQPARRTPLRIVAPPDPEVRSRRRRRLIVAALVGLACAGLFAIVGVRVLLAQGQAPVDVLESKVTTAQAENQRLRLDVASLESPSRIVAEAQRRLAMVPPATVTYLEPIPASDAQPAG